jgi:hypothetical protein
MRSIDGHEDFEAAPPPDHLKKTDPNTPHCVACGGYHGAVNLKIACLERMIGTLRAVLREKVAQWDTFQAHAKEHYALPMSAGGAAEARAKTKK